MPRLSKIGAACLSAFGFGTGSAGVTASYLVVAGGGGGGYRTGGGGGAGGYQTNTTTLNLTQSYTVLVGAGGVGGTSGTSNGSAGSSSQFGSLTASVGGGGGGSYGNPAGANGVTGGSGGGGSQAGSGAAGTSGQGSAGGNGISGSPYSGGGGGGAGAVGSNASGNNAGSGGVGVSSSITGTATYYAGGGGGGTVGSLSGVAGSGGNGGGAAGTNSSATPANATANTGGGGGGGGADPAANGSNGGSGVVIVAYAGAQKFGGGIVSTDGTNTIHTFKTSGQLVPMTPITASYLIVAGGGGAGTQSAGGGGAGGLLTGSTLSIDTSSTYIVTVGSGGAGAPAAGSGACVAGSNGTNSYFSIVSTTAIGGGGSGSYRPTGGLAGATGGSGGGGAIPTGVGGSGTAGQGYAGGQGGTDSNNNLDVGGGGGGAGAAGVSYNDANTAIRGDGGIGVSSSITGTATYYAGGGGGATHNGTRAGTGGLGGGGNGAATNANGANGTANTGGGGGGGSEYTNTGGNGGSGIVVIRYAGTTQLMAGGTVTIVGGNVIHTFTSSGYLTPLTFIGRSLRFRSSANAYLSRTPTVTSNQKTWTWSGWVKRGSFGTEGLFTGWHPASGGSYVGTSIRFNDANLAVFSYPAGTYDWNLVTTQVFRDPAAWYHLVVSVDTTQATASNRVKLYVNGRQVTAFSTETYPSQNYDTRMNTSGSVMSVGCIGFNNAPFQYLDGYMADVRFIDGQALTPNSFGTFNSYGVWQPINYGGSYGTNGFNLDFSDTTSTTTLCYDKSPQGNHWTPNNISLTSGSTYDSMTDVPTLTSATASNYCVWNPLDSPNNTLSNGNLLTTHTSSSNRSRGTLGVSSGKWYLEFTIASYASGGEVGLDTITTTNTSNTVGTQSTNWGFLTSDGRTYNNNVLTAYGSSATTGDVIMCAFDMDSGKLWFGKNGTWFASGNPATGTNPAFTNLTGTLTPATGTNGGSTQAISLNCGQQPFAYTPPTGFVALNTYNL